jgi:hypothetical protein
LLLPPLLLLSPLSLLLLQVALFKEASQLFHFKAIPYEKLKSGDKVVVCAATADDCTMEMVDEYWYGIVGLITKSGIWIKFYDVLSDEFIQEEKHCLKLADYYDRWMRVERVAI